MGVVGCFIGLLLVYIYVTWLIIDQLIISAQHNNIAWVIVWTVALVLWLGGSGAAADNRK